MTKPIYENPNSLEVALAMYAHVRTEVIESVKSRDQITNFSLATLSAIFLPVLFTSEIFP